jgi:hypothetical protein
MLLRAERQSQNNIYLYSPSMSEADRALTGVTMTPSLTEAVAASVARHSGGGMEDGGDGKYRVAVIPEGPYIIPTSLGYPRY